MKVSFAHIINTIAPSDNPGMYKVQELTIRTILAAKKNAPPGLDIQLMSAQFANARPHLPVEFQATSDLVTVASAYPGISTALKLPLIKEILSRLNENTTATHFVFSNLDICLMPFFYSTVENYLRQGYDAVIINRRRIPVSLMEEKNLDVLYAEAGETHTGYDCFVFSRELLSKFILHDVFIGTPPAGNDIFYNVFTFADNPVLLTQKHLTFHVGMDLVKPWGTPVLHAHNQREFIKILKELKPQMDVSKFPGAGYGFFKRHFKWLMNPTFHYPTMCALDFRQLSKARRKPAGNELPGMANRYYEWMIRKINFRDKD